ncbi:MAG: hypothetical protein IPO67_14795 [Deltaproteobacteria bacterium]|nr:hypothetical protein [Deltaproteobacteria bacterium]
MRFFPLALALLCAACEEPRFGGLAQALAEHDRGRALLDAGDAPGAAAAFAQAITLDPTSADLELWRGRALAAFRRPARRHRRHQRGLTQTFRRRRRAVQPRLLPGPAG